MIALLAMIATDAQGASVTQKLCFQLDTDYDELIPQGTWWTTNDHRNMFGVYIQVHSPALPFALTAYADEAGSDAGCATFNLDDSLDYTVLIKEKAQIYGRDVYVVDGTTDPISAVDSLVMETNYVPTGTTRTYTVAHTMEWGALNVATWMFRRNSFGLGAGAHSLRIAVPGSGPTAANVNYIRINTHRKRAMSHEIGHWIGMRRDENTIIVHDGTAPLLGCDGGGGDDLTREYDSRAASEGWADYVAAWAWNTQNENKCALQKSNTDWDFDLDGDIDPMTDEDAGWTTADRGQWGCEGQLEDINSASGINDYGEPLWTGWTGGTSSPNYDPPSPWPLTKDWLERMATSDDDDQDGVQCHGSLAGVSSKADWVRFFWDFCRDYSITATQCASVFDAANPRSWDGDPDGTGYLNDDPIRRMKNAATNAGFLTEFNATDGNGLDHY